MPRIKITYEQMSEAAGEEEEDADKEKASFVARMHPRGKMRHALLAGRRPCGHWAFLMNG